MGSVSLGHHSRPSRLLRPLNPSSLMGIQENEYHKSNGQPQPDISSMLKSTSLNQQPSDDDESESDESDWEQEVSKDGSVHFVDPLSVEEAAGFAQRTPMSTNDPQTAVNPRDSNGKKLSRLVRRRESKRDRNTPCNVVLKTPGGSESVSGQASGGTAKGNPWRVSNSHESSDNDSSTYGQIKTFEAFFEATNLDRSVASPPPIPTSSKGQQDLSSKDEVTEIHEVTLKFQAKQLKAQIPHFQMLLHGDNPANRGLLLEALLGIVPEVKPLRVEGSSAISGGHIIDNSVVIASLTPQGVAFKSSDNLKCGDIIRSLDGQHVTLDTVNTFLLNKLTKASSSSASGKVKLILQRPMGRVARPHPAEFNARQSAELSKQFSQLDEHAWGLLRNAQVLAAIISNDGIGADNSDSDAPAVIYLLPTSSASTESPLLSVRGIFSTLVQLLPDVVSSEPISTDLMLRVGSDSNYSEQWLHVSYGIDKEEILLVGLPGKLRFLN